MKKAFNYISIISISLIISSCGSSGDDGEIVSNDTTSIKSEQRSSQAKTVLNAIPSPVETVALLKSAGAKYNPKYLNPIENVSNYSTAATKALNLGVYGCDLSFTSIFDQTQESMLYLRCANTLSNELGIMGVFDENTSARLEANQNDKDSLLSIISQSFFTADTYLNNNGQPGISTLIVAGGWIEGLSIATKVAADTKKEEVSTQIIQQQTSLDNLIKLLELQVAESDDVKKMLTQLKDLKKVFETVGISASDSTASTAAKVSAEQLKLISDKANEIRDKMIK
jgi:hypothetical protein